MKEKLISVGKGALVAAAGAALAYLMQWASGTDLGPYGPVVVAGLSVVVNLLRKLSETPKPE